MILCPSLWYLDFEHVDDVLFALIFLKQNKGVKFQNNSA
jgi:hypothetical protein